MIIFMFEGANHILLFKAEAPMKYKPWSSEDTLVARGDWRTIKYLYKYLKKIPSKQKGHLCTHTDVYNKSDYTDMFCFELSIDQTELQPVLSMRETRLLTGSVPDKKQSLESRREQTETVLLQVKVLNPKAV